jgi:cyclophilin family peptidyl-prolyl cis-trans isomerase
MAGCVTICQGNTVAMLLFSRQSSWLGSFVKSVVPSTERRPRSRRNRPGADWAAGHQWVSTFAESLEPRRLLTNTPVLASFADVTLLSGSPLHIPLNGSDADDQVLTFSATSDNADITTYIPESNRSLEINVQTFGTMTFELFEDKAARATEQIITLAESGFYDGSTFHRVINRFVIQGGDPDGNPVGTGGSSLGDFDDQFHEDLQHNTTGVLSMAKSLDDTNDSQFFITEGAQRHLDSQHTVFGLLTTGESVREAISEIAVTNSVPDAAVIVNSANVFTDIENGVLMLSAPEGVTGSATITVIVADPDGNQSQQTFDVTIQADPQNNQPFLADIPAVRTLADTPTEIQLTRIDLENNAATFLDEDLLGINGLFVPEVSHTDLVYTISGTTGTVSVTPTNGLTGTHNITAAVGEFSNAIDYQLVAIEIVAAASTWTVSTDDHPNGNEADDGSADTFRIVNNRTRIEVYINDVLSAQAERVSVTDIVIDGSGDDDILMLDGTGGDPLPAGGFTFNGGGQTSADGDRIEAVNGTVTSVGHAASLSVAGEGTITIDGTASQYNGVERIVDRLIATDRSFSLTDADESIVIRDDGTSSNGLSRISSNGSALPVDFADPTGSLTVNSLGGNDGVTIQNLDSGAFGVIVNGGAGADTLTGGRADDQLNGGEGDDTILGGGGNDDLNGGTGSDTLNVVANSHLSISTTSTSGVGNDSHQGFERAILTAGSGNNRLDATAANIPVTLNGLGGNDTLLGGSSTDRLDGGDGIDFVEIAGANIVLTDASAPGADGDTLISIEGLLLIASVRGSSIDASGYTLGPVTIVGSGGADTLKGGSGDDVILGGGGPDVADGGPGDDLLMGGSGNDNLSGAGGDDTIIGGRGRDTIEGGLDADVLLGGGGSDTIGGGDGDDRIRGGGGRDVLDGDDGPDTLVGGAGRDNLAGGLGTDNLNGTDRDDNFNQQVGPDILIGGLRPAARPAPVSGKDDPANEQDTPHFLSPPAFGESTEEIDEAFGQLPLPELMEL